MIGASPNPSRYAHRAVMALQQHGHPAIPLGIRKGEIGTASILTEWPEIKEVDTVTLYLGPSRQAPHLDYILSLKPKRVIFNPGTENPELEHQMKAAGIETLEACTLVMLATGQY